MAIRFIVHVARLGTFGPDLAKRTQETPMLPTARKLAFSDVPVIDLGPAWSGDAAARRSLADEIADVCGRVGFFYVKNHGLSDADIAAIFQTSADFHNLPLDAKMEVS